MNILELGHADLLISCWLNLEIGHIDLLVSLGLAHLYGPKSTPSHGNSIPLPTPFASSVVGKFHSF